MLTFFCRYCIFHNNNTILFFSVNIHNYEILFSGLHFPPRRVIIYTYHIHITTGGGQNEKNVVAGIHRRHRVRPLYVRQMERRRTDLK